MSDESESVTTLAEERAKAGGPIYQTLFESDNGYAVIAFLSWVGAAGAYGYIAGVHGEQPPEAMWPFLLLGLGIGMGLIAAVEATREARDGE